MKSRSWNKVAELGFSQSSRADFRAILGYFFKAFIIPVSASSPFGVSLLTSLNYTKNVFFLSVNQGSYLAVPPKPSSPVDCCICKPCKYKLYRRTASNITTPTFTIYRFSINNGTNWGRGRRGRGMLNDE